MTTGHVVRSATSSLVRKPLQVTESNGIRRFSNNKVQSAINNALAKLPKDHKLAVVAHADLEGASLTTVVKLDDKWSVQAGAYKPWRGKLSAEAEVVWSPF